MDNRPKSNVRPMRRPAHNPSSPGRRMRANWPAELRIGSARISCHVIDISVGGAKLKAADPVPGNAMKGWLVLDGFGPMETELLWRKQELVGLRFLRDYPELGDMQTRRFDSAAWLKDGGAEKSA
jgi:hypothetical protein